MSTKPTSERGRNPSAYLAKKTWMAPLSSIIRNIESEFDLLEI